MAFKNGLRHLAALAVLCFLVSCASAPDTANVTDSPAAASAEPPNEEQLAAAQAQWKARQDKVSEVLASIDRETFIGESPIRGNPNAELVIVKFSDFECPFCAVASVHMKDLMEERGEEVLYVYKHLPLTSIHPEAVPSAKASWAAGQQGQFWFYHNGLFANQERLGDGLYVELAEQMGLDVEQFNRDRNSDAAQAAVDADLDLANQLELRGTPSFLMGGLLVPSGVPPENFGELIDNLTAMPVSQETEE